MFWRRFHALCFECAWSSCARVPSPLRTESVVAGKNRRSDEVSVGPRQRRGTYWIRMARCGANCPVAVAPVSPTETAESSKDFPQITDVAEPVKLADVEASKQSREARVKKAPTESEAVEAALHAATHIPSWAWCIACVASCAAEDLHWCKEPDAQGHGHEPVSFDFGFLGVNNTPTCTRADAHFSRAHLTAHNSYSTALFQSGTPHWLKVERNLCHEFLCTHVLLVCHVSVERSVCPFPSCPVLTHMLCVKNPSDLNLVWWRWTKPLCLRSLEWNVWLVGQSRTQVMSQTSTAA